VSDRVLSETEPLVSPEPNESPRQADTPSNSPILLGLSRVDVDPPEPDIPRLRRLGCMSYRVWKETRHEVSIIRKEK